MSALSDDFLKTARHLLKGSSGPASPAELRRAVSTAYYAVFHALAHVCADRLIGSSNAASQGAAWGQVYRALEHGFARNACEQAKGLGFSEGITTFAIAFVSLQQERHRADYAPTTSLSPIGAAELISMAETAISALQDCTTEEQTAFSALVLLKLRKSER